MISFTILVTLIFLGSCYKASTTRWTDVKEEWACLAAITGLILFGMLSLFCFKYLP